MSFGFLDDKSLLQILKRVPFDSICKLRRTSKRLNNLILEHGLNRPHLRHLCLEPVQQQGNGIWIKVTAKVETRSGKNSPDAQIRTFSRFMQDDIPIQVFPNTRAVIKQIKSIKELWLERMIIPDLQLPEVLNNEGIGTNTIERIRLKNCEIQLSTEDLVKFCQQFKHIILDESNFSEEIMCDELLCKILQTTQLHINERRIGYRVHRERITDETLRFLMSHLKPNFVLYGAKTLFSFDMISQMFSIACHNNRHAIEWQFGILTCQHFHFAQEFAHRLHEDPTFPYKAMKLLDGDIWRFQLRCSNPTLHRGRFIFSFFVEDPKAHLNTFDLGPATSGRTTVF